MALDGAKTRARDGEDNVSRSGDDGTQELIGII